MHWPSDPLKRLQPRCVCISNVACVKYWEPWLIAITAKKVGGGMLTLRLGFRFITTVKFRHLAELNGATKKALPFFQDARGDLSEPHRRFRRRDGGSMLKIFRFSTGEPLRVLVAGAVPVGDALAAQKGDVTLHASLKVLAVVDIDAKGEARH
jgi:hypothetical protein